MRRLHEGFIHWDVALSDPVFVEESELTFEREVVSCRRESLFALSDDRWSGFLENNKTWLNASLLVAEDGQHVISILPGPVVTSTSCGELSVNLSLERRPLTLSG